tara:strand:- start:2571 stop:2717 length:147 start_codon:yes stop_codon:yes gene_type:complete
MKKGNGVCFSAWLANVDRKKYSISKLRKCWDLDMNIKEAEAAINEERV